MSLPGLFALLAKDDLPRALDALRNLKGEAPRAISTLALAQVLLKR